jgi:predicted ATPase
VWWVDLAPVTAARTVDALAAATGAELPRTTDPAGSLCRALRTARGVLCLDNAEHLLAELAPLVERLAATAPDLAVLATSRERLAVGCEHVHPLAPLPAAADRENPAVRLFVERAPGLEAAALSDDDVAAVAEVCRRLDGLPLAIELGAARAPAFGVRELAARLGDRLDLLAGGRRTAAARHRTLRAVVDWSHELLSPEEARLFGRLAVFPSAFSLDQAEEVCADEHIPRSAVPTLLARLVEQSVVQAGQGRLWLLETLRAYAAERVDDEPALPARHARFTAQRLAAQRLRLSTAEEPAAVAALVAMDADLHAAWTWAVERDRALAVQLAGDVYDYAYHRQRRDLLAWGLAVGDWHTAYLSDHPRLPDAAAAAWSAGLLDAAAELAARGVRAAGGSPRCGRAVIQLSNMAMFDGRTDEAVAGFRRAAALHRAAGEDVRALLCEISVAHAFNSGGRNGEAAALVGELLARARASGNPTAVCWALHVTGDAVAPLDADRAAAAYAAAIEQASAVDNRLFLLLARASSVTLAARHGDPTRWLVEFDRAIEQCTDVGNEAMLLWWLLPLAGLLARVGAVHEAAVLAGGVRAARAGRPRLPRDEARLAETLAHLRARLGARATDDAVAEGATMPLADLVASARRAIRAARG